MSSLDARSTVHRISDVITRNPLRLTVATAEQPPSLDDLLVVTLANTLDLKCRVMFARWRARQVFDCKSIAVLDDLNDDLDFLADDIGQRISTRGREPLAEPEEIAFHSTLPSNGGRTPPPSMQMETLCAAIAAARWQLLAAIDAALRDGDAATGEVLSRLLRRLIRKQDARMTVASGN